jgi:hypothetical protein
MEPNIADVHGQSGLLVNVGIYLFKSDKGQLTATNISQRLKLSKSSLKKKQELKVY